MYRTILFVLALAASTFAQSGNGGIALAPARFELEMKPGTETTVVVNLDYRASGEDAKPVRIVATLNDWSLSRDGMVNYFPANTLPNSAAPWMIYSPGEAPVTPGKVHQIRVTVSVPPDAAPGDHLAALIVEQRPDNLKTKQNERLMVIRYRLASVFYIKVGQLTKKGEFENLVAESTPDGIAVTPFLKNSGNSVIRPTASVTLLDSDGKAAAAFPETEMLPVMAGAESRQRLFLERKLPPGKYTVKCRIDFQDGRAAIEGVTEMIVGAVPDKR